MQRQSKKKSRRTSSEVLIKNTAKCFRVALMSSFYGKFRMEKTLAYGAIRGMLLTWMTLYTSFHRSEILRS
jgi:hypothetical protein